jgi:hypothetical protein
MQFNRAHLDNFQKPFFILDVQVLVFLTVMRELEGLYVRA